MPLASPGANTGVVNTFTAAQIFKAGPVAMPEGFGAVGDGSTDDTAALQAALATGLPVWMKTGATYLHRQPLALNAGQVIQGNGATLKRAAQVVTTTTSAITTGVTTAITVASTTGFQVGDYITVEKSGVYDGTARQISSIVGSVITVSTAFVFSSASGTVNVRHAYWQVQVGAANCRITNLKIDGNSSNWSWNRTWLMAGIISSAGSDGLLIDHCNVVNQPGDGLQIGLASGIVAAHNKITACAGRGICWAGNVSHPGVGNRCTNNYIDTTGTDSASDTSPDGSSRDGQGCVQLSSYEGDLLISGNYLANGIKGVGSLSSSDNSDITITDNEIRTMSSYAIEGDTAASSTVANVLISGNRIYSTSGILAQVPGGGNAFGPTRWTIRGNVLYESVVLAQLAAGLIIEGNHFYSAGTTLDLITLGNNGAASKGVAYCTVTGNVLVGGKRGVVPAEFDGQIVISSNVMVGQYTRGVEVASGTGAVNMLIDANVIASSSASDGSNYMAIKMRGPSKASNNSIDVTAGGYGGIILAANNRGVIADNTVIGTGTNSIAPYRIQVQAGSYGVLKNNVLDTPYIDGGTNTIKSGNVTTPSSPSSGRAVLVAGTVTVTTAEVRTGDNILLTTDVAGGTLGVLSVGTIVDQTTFVINSSSGSDTSTVYWEIRH